MAIQNCKQEEVVLNSHVRCFQPQMMLFHQTQQMTSPPDEKPNIKKSLLQVHCGEQFSVLKPEKMNLPCLCQKSDDVAEVGAMVRSDIFSMKRH